MPFSTKKVKWKLIVSLVLFNFWKSLAYPKMPLCMFVCRAFPNLASLLVYSL
jgi:hypothetical protein